MIQHLEIAGGKPRLRQLDARLVRYKVFSWSMALKLPTLNQTRFGIGGRGWGDLWMDTKP
jgi:hypothetical protein